MDTRAEKEYISVNIDNLIASDKSAVLLFLSRQVDHKLLVQHGDGTHVALNKLDENIIHNIYFIIKNKIETFQTIPLIE